MDVACQTENFSFSACRSHRNLQIFFFQYRFHVSEQFKVPEKCEIDFHETQNVWNLVM